MLDKPRDRPKTCVDYPGAPACCLSCHEDADEFWPDYPLSEIYNSGGNVIAEVCCSVQKFAKSLEEVGDAKP